MKAEVIIESGQARLLKPVYLKPSANKRFEIEIPDDAVAAPRDWFSDESTALPPSSVKPSAPAGGLQEELNGLLGGLARVRPGVSIGDDHQRLVDAMEERHGSH